MSHDQGRPSLFAGMEEEAMPHGHGQRVRILSTLESSWRPGGPTRKGPPSRMDASPRQHRSWLMLAGLGSATLLASLAVLMQQRQAHPESVMPTPSQEAPSPMIREAQLEQPELQPARAGASAVDSGGALPLAHAEASSVSSSASQALIPESTPARQDESTSTVPAAVSVSPQKPTKRAPEGQLTTSKQRPSAHKPNHKAGASDQDVELIEAVITHANPRPAPKP
ncbi:MAG TPA: hypothetical protein VFM48_07115 [Aquabacterium sp.]|nr:hypothetical protein [Aquabacterium sp.]